MYEPFDHSMCTESWTFFDLVVGLVAVVADTGLVDAVARLSLSACEGRKTR